ncbi:hypothetical protein XA68_12020 [Ophiocordyceps unilateralis]|uniref:Uncharacterized protein n=1 Tax=Ophiocordyceps unilateralis TaxID=268505 RepID=A0A2A9PFN8_OPHUN|nr:hypothetical protein XA68_12020 [Ophiocordyceps unilateralis]
MLLIAVSVPRLAKTIRAWNWSCAGMDARDRDLPTYLPTYLPRLRLQGSWKAAVSKLGGCRGKGSPGGYLGELGPLPTALFAEDPHKQPTSLSCYGGRYFVNRLSSCPGLVRCTFALILGSSTSGLSTSTNPPTYLYPLCHCFFVFAPRRRRRRRSRRRCATCLASAPSPP